ncbi:hypothetical protein N2152v2_007571 [Parachlorella kessleri]
MEDTFIEERLAAAIRLSPSQRSPEVAVFIEACQLQQEVALARKKPGRGSTRKQQALGDLKLVRSHVLSIAPLCYRPGLHLANWGHLCSAANITDFEIVGDTGNSVMELLEADFSLGTLLLVAAGVSRSGPGEAHITRLLPVYNSMVEKLQRPAVAARLRQELEQLQADLPSRLLTYEQLLERFVMLAYQDCEDLAGSGDNSMEDDVESAKRALLERAQQQGSDFVVGYCGYELAAWSADYEWYARRVAPGQTCGSMAGSVAAEVVAPPSAFLGWLKQARQAHARCQAVLPGQWLAGLKARQEAALACKPWLQRQQQQGDRWQPPNQAEARRIRAQEARQAKAAADRSERGSRNCQKADWVHHKSECKANQQRTKGQGV